MIRKRILMVDDNPLEGELVAGFFEEEIDGIDFHVITHGEDALNYLAQNISSPGSLPHLILLDINMPGKSGFELLADLRADNTLRPIPVVIFSSSSSQKDVRSAFDIGANAYLVKPLQYDRMVVLLNNLVLFWFDISEILDN